MLVGTNMPKTRKAQLKPDWAFLFDSVRALGVVLQFPPPSVRVADIRIRVVKGGVDRIHEQPIQPGKSFHEILLVKTRESQLQDSRVVCFVRKTY